MKHLRSIWRGHCANQYVAVVDKSANIRVQPVEFLAGNVYCFRKAEKRFLRRFICFDLEHDELIFLDIDATWIDAPRNAIALKRVIVLKLFQSGGITAAPDYIRPSFMSSTDDELKLHSPKALIVRQKKHLTDEERGKSLSAWLRKRDLAFQVIEALVSTEKRPDRQRLLVAAYSPRYCSRTVADFARSQSVSLQVVKRLLHRYAWFGLDKNSLLSLDASKGACGLLTRCCKRKPGPVDAAVTIYGEKYANRPCRPADLITFYLALEKFWVGQHLTLKKTYDFMKEVFYRKANQFGSFPIQGTRVPTRRMFEYAARILIQRNSLRARREGHKDGKAFAARRGFDTDIAQEIAAVFDIDGTPFNRELVVRFKVDGKSINMGKPYVVLVFDRRSKKCVGWHVYVGNENWKEGYRLALFCALTSKKARLKWLEIDEATAWRDDENLKPCRVYVDGGAGASKKGRAALERLGIDFHVAPPDTPYWKPTVEGALGFQQAEQSHLDGGYDRTKSAVQKDSKRTAKLHANSTIWEFERELVMNIIQYNGRTQKNIRLTAQMKEESGPNRTPDSVYSAGVARMGGVDHRRLLAADVYERLLHHADVAVTADGVKYLKSQYNSGRLQHHRLYSGCKAIRIFFDPLRLETVYWRTSDGTIDVLERDTASGSVNGFASAYDIQNYELAMLAVQLAQSRARPTRSKLSARQKTVLLETVEPSKTKVRKSASKHMETTRGVEGEYQRNARPYDRAEDFLERKYDAPLPVPCSPWRDDTIENNTTAPSQVSGTGQKISQPNTSLDATAPSKTPPQPTRASRIASLNKLSEESEK